MNEIGHFGLVRTILSDVKKYDNEMEDDMEEDIVDIKEEVDNIIDINNNQI